jgi:1-aminocyclopropane-1-carboxylate deaminase/D-cysteine desulfhydrase-like pyridoxal-dependent ACC family enzyme
MEALFREQTPTERHRLRRQEIFVKRDDLYGIAPAPPLAKMRGLRVVLGSAYDRGIRVVGCWDTRVSMLGPGVAACCRELPGMRCLVSYPVGKWDATPAPALLAQHLGAELLPVPAARLNICLAAARRLVEARGGWMLPFGLECAEAVEGVAREAARINASCYENGTIVLSCGSGVTLTGLLRGLLARPCRIIGISSGRSRQNILRCVTRYLPEAPAHLEIVEAAVPYRVAIDYPCPFPANPYYDLKAWKHLAENLPRLAPPVLFWNIGAPLPTAEGLPA